ncbi:hypothetical protein [Streptomyces sp. NPDC053069]
MVKVGGEVPADRGREREHSAVDIEVAVTDIGELPALDLAGGQPVEGD